MRDLLIKAEWFNGLENAPEEIKQELFYRIIKVGCLEEEIDDTNDSWDIKNIWNNIAGNVRRMKNAQEKAQEFGKTHGRKMKGDPQAIYDYCQENPSAKADEVGIALGLPQTATAKAKGYGYIYDNPGWKNRRVKDWKFSDENSVGILKSEKNSEIEEENQKEFSEKDSESEKNSEKSVPYVF